MNTGISYLTIRGQAKEGRVTDAKVIGNPKRGDRVVIMDDVITNGESKIVSLRNCIELGLDTMGLVVFVDRQQGWRKLLSERGIELPVWAGMTLDDVRRHLIQTLGVMQRCDPKVEEKNPIIVALDGKDWETILPVIDQLRTTGCILKVNDLLFDQGIERLLPKLSTYGRVMADLKLHDISNTVGNVANRLLACPPWAVTVHGSGGEKMIKAAADTLKPVGTKVLVITVLTSIDEKTCKEVYARMPAKQVAKLAAIAHRAGADGLVCSAEEVADLRNKYPGMLLVAPGIRSVGQDAGDQERTGTPEQATANGSDHLVMGRQIFKAEDPVFEVHRLLGEELKIAI
ncbi:orotidine-5'-phosphate decarboxylase [Patescibacteria group bacterium]